MKGACHEFACLRCYDNDRECDRSSERYRKRFAAELENMANGVVKKKPARKPRVRKSPPAGGSSRGRRRVQPTRVQPPRAGPSRLPARAPTPPPAAAPAHSPSPVPVLRELLGLGGPLPPARLDSAERLSDDALALLRVELTCAEGFTSAWALHRDSVQRRILGEVELRVAESLSPGSRSSRAKGKGKARAEPPVEEPAPPAPSEDEFESWGGLGPGGRSTV